MNGLAYFFNINVVTELKNVFDEKPEIQIESTLNQDISGPLMISKKFITYLVTDLLIMTLKPFAKAFDGEMATYEQVLEEQKKVPVGAVLVGLKIN